MVAALSAVLQRDQIQTPKYLNKIKRELLRYSLWIRETQLRFEAHPVTSDQLSFLCSASGFCFSWCKMQQNFKPL